MEECHKVTKKEKRSYEETHGQVTCTAVGLRADQRAENQTKFGVVQIDGDEYALIDANEDKLILQRCETNNDCIKIYVNTYLCLENDIAIKFEKFGNVQRITD